MALHAKRADHPFDVLTRVRSRGALVIPQRGKPRARKSVGNQSRAAVGARKQRRVPVAIGGAAPATNTTRGSAHRPAGGRGCRASPSSRAPTRLRRFHHSPQVRTLAAIRLRRGPTLNCRVFEARVLHRRGSPTEVVASAARVEGGSGRGRISRDGDPPTIPTTARRISWARQFSSGEGAISTAVGGEFDLDAIRCRHEL